MRAKKVLSILFALALVLSSLPASAIAESIEDAGKYSVVVSYVNVLNDEEIHAPSKQVVNEGESWSVTAPTITGYDLEDLLRQPLLALLLVQITTLNRPSITCLVMLPTPLSA